MTWEKEGKKMRTQQEHRRLRHKEMHFIGSPCWADRKPGRLQGAKGRHRLLLPEPFSVNAVARAYVCLM